MSTIKSLNSQYQPYQEENPGLSPTDGDTWGDSYDSYDFELEDFSEDSFSDDCSCDAGGEASGAWLTAADLRDELKALEAELKANPDISWEQREDILDGFHSRINVSVSLANPEKQQEVFSEILMEMESTGHNLPEMIQLSEEIDALVAEIESTEFPAAQAGKKDEWIETLKKEKSKIDLNLEESSATLEVMDEIRGEFEEMKGLVEEQNALLNAPIDNLLGYLQSKGDKTTTAEGLKQALNEAGLTLQDLQNIALPTNAVLHQKLFNFIVKADPRFAQLLQENSENPFAEEVISRFTETLTQIIPDASGITPANAQKILKDAGQDPYPAKDAVASHIDEANNGFEAKSFAHAIDVALETGDWTAVRERFIGLSGELGNDIMRKFLTGLFKAVGGDETAMQKALDRIPADIRESMASIAYATWAERSEKHDGDRWNSHETQEILYNSVYN